MQTAKGAAEQHGGGSAGRGGLQGGAEKCPVAELAASVSDQPLCSCGSFLISRFIYLQIRN